MRKIPLHFSDIDFGTEEFGFIPVEPGEDPDDSDRRYERHLAAQGVRGSIDRMGNLVVEGPTRRGSLRLTEGQLRQIIRQEARALREAINTSDQWYDVSPKELFIGKAQKMLDALVSELTTIDRDMARGLDAMDIHAALDDSGPYMGHGVSPLHQAVHWMRKDTSPNGLANFFYEGLYRKRPSAGRLASEMMSHYGGSEQIKLEPGQTAPNPKTVMWHADRVAERIAEDLKIVKVLKKAAHKASTMGAAAKSMLAPVERVKDTTTVSYSGPDIEIRSGRDGTEAGFGDGTVESWAEELERLAKWCSTKKRVEFQAANDLSATAYDPEGNDVDSEYITWMAGGRDMAREFSKMAKFFRRNVGNKIEVFSD